MYRRQNLKAVAKDCMLKLSERKHVTTNVTGVVPAAGALYGLNILSQGTSTTTRIGNQVHHVSLNLRGDVYLPATSAGDIFRVIVVCDKMPGGGLPAVGDILESSSIIANFNMDKVPSRFTVLCDKHMNFENSSATVTVQQKYISIYKKLGTIAFYSGNAGTIGDLLRNSLVVLIISNSGLVTCNLNFQLCYKDL